MLRILIVDDHDIVRRGLRDQLAVRKDWTISGEACNGREAIRLALELEPDLVIMDLSMPEMNGLEATRQIRRVLCRTEVLVFTMHESEQMIANALEAGARGYVVKADAESQLFDAIEALSRHKAYFTGRVSETLLEAFLKVNGIGPTKPCSGLTDREREIVQMLAEGRSNKEVANELCISLKTVETHRASVMRKLDVTSIVGLVHYAIRNDLVQA